MTDDVGSERDSKTRIQFDLSRRSLERVDYLVEHLDAATRAEVVRRALHLYLRIYDAHQRNARLFIQEVNGTPTAFDPFF